ncbi:hypothetical protein LXL04_000721 [Taraxacum kok-saghyz]
MTLWLRKHPVNSKRSLTLWLWGHPIKFLKVYDLMVTGASSIQEDRKLTIEASKKAHEIQNQDIYLSFILKLDTEMKKLQVFYTEIGYASEIRSCSYLWDAEN